MTFVITHTEGHLACFTVAEDGSLTQHALIDTGSAIHTPQDLVKLGLGMARQYGWNGEAVSVPIRHTRAKAIERPKGRGPRAKPTIRHGLQPNEPEGLERERFILQYVEAHPNCTLKDMILGAGLKYENVINGRWNHFTNRLVKNGLILKVRNTRPYEFRGLGTVSQRPQRDQTDPEGISDAITLREHEADV